MRSYSARFLIGFGLASLAGCAPPAPPPPPDTVNQAMADALIDTGFYSEVAIARIIGRHYSPAEDAWTLVACYNFNDVQDRQGTACLDSFSAVQLDSDAWIVGATVNNVYRWRAIGIGAESTDVRPAPPPDPAQPPEQEPDERAEPQPRPQDGPPPEQE